MSEKRLQETILEALRWQGWLYVDVGGDCWQWTGSDNGNGYGQYWHDNKLWRAHRLVWTLLVGPIPEGMELDHLCKNKGCVNTDHLEIVTPKENKRRRQRPYCKRGHRMAGINIYIHRKTGYRYCRACRKERDDRYHGRS